LPPSIQCVQTTESSAPASGELDPAPALGAEQTPRLSAESAVPPGPAPLRPRSTEDLEALARVLDLARRIEADIE